MKISHSSWTRYLTCPRMWQLHYVERLRPTGTSSPLLFGTAMDEALNHLLLTRDIGGAIMIFREHFKPEDADGVNWDDRDCDNSLVQRDSADTDSTFAWKCMRVKGRMLLEKYNEKIMPEILEVESVQKDLHNRPGVIDAIVTLRGHGRVLIDNKTAARPYQPDSVTNSTQLALYAHDQGIKKIGFAVLIKQIKSNAKRLCLSCGYDGSYIRHKTCPKDVNGVRCHGTWDESFAPEAQVQLLVEEAPKRLGELVVESMSQVERAIEAGVFPCNISAHRSYFGKESPYLNYLLTGNKAGLEISPERKKK